MDNIHQRIIDFLNGNGDTGLEPESEVFIEEVPVEEVPVNGEYVSAEQEYSESNVISYFLGLSNQLHLFHWFSSKHSEHVILDELYEKVNEMSDKIVEALLSYDEELSGSPEMVSPAQLIPYEGIEQVLSYVKNSRETIQSFVELDSTTEIASLRDELVEAFDKAIYLLSMENC